ncbi:MAG: hypothetical protein ABI416_05930 [Ginsengibacter sp.]
MTVVVPCDFNQTKVATLAIADYLEPVYLGFGRPKWPNFMEENQHFEIGKAQALAEGNDVGRCRETDSENKMRCHRRRA